MSRRTLFSIWLQGQREKLGLSLDSLCERMGCTIEELRTIEAGRAMPGKEMAGRLADIFDVPEDERPAFILFASSDLDADTDFEASDLAGDETPWRHRETPPNNLPAQLTSFIGREGEVDKVAGLLRRPQTRLLTMTGPPGIGKTRLSQEVGARFLGESLFEDGIFFVPLAPITEPELVAGAMAQTLNVKETSGQSTLESLKEFLRERRMLLVMDNFEQIVPAGSVLAELLGVCEGLKALVTSREALHIYGEQVFFVPPMELPRKDSVPTAETLEQWEAADLFMQRARAARPDFAVDDEGARIIGEICRRLDGLPLAIELAAARASILSPLGILSRLDNRLKLLTGGSRNLPPRQQTLRSAIDWSYDLLDEDEGRLFRYLSVFVGGCTLEAAEAVATQSPGGARPAMDLVSSLLDKSLLKQEEGAEGEPRFMMLETIREYGLERLAESGEEAAVRRAHALYMVQLAEEAEPHLTSAARAPWLARLDAELDNIRSALAWSQTEAGDAELGLRLAGALHWFWYFRSYITEGRRWLGEVVSLPANQVRTKVRAKALTAAGSLARLHVDSSQVRFLLHESVSIWRESQDNLGLGGALVLLGIGKLRQLEQSGLDDMREGVRLLREVGDTWYLAYSLDLLADYEHSDKSERLYEESLSIYRQLDDKWGIANELFELGREALLKDRYDRAREQLEEAISIGANVWGKLNNAHATRMLGMVNQFEGNHSQAETLFKRSLELYRDVGDLTRTASSYRSLGDLAFVTGHHESSGTYYASALEIYQRSGENVIVNCLAGLARLAAAHGLWEIAARFFGAIEAGSASPRSRMVNREYSEYEQLVVLVRKQMGQSAFDDARMQGAGMTHEHAFIEAQRLARLPSPVGSSAQTRDIATPAGKYPAGLSGREVEVLRQVAFGLSNADIASKLFLSANTVRAHLFSIYSKINVSSRTAAARFAVENGLV